MDAKRNKPYIWPSWITKLMAGEDRCWYKAWYKAQHRYTRVPEDPERAEFFREWTAKHDEITNRHVDRLRAEGWTVKVEDEGSFKLQGSAADVSGKPDLVAMRDEEAVVIDAKSGKRRDSDHWQVLLYLFALPLTWLRGTTYRLRGEVAYGPKPSDLVPVRALGELERGKIVATIQRITSNAAPPASPSQFECRYCDIQNCSFRLQPEPRGGGDTTNLF